MIALLDYYRIGIRLSIQSSLQYRLANYIWMLGMIAEPIIYLVVWQTVSRDNGGSVGGYTAAQFAAYYIIWTLVRNINIVFTPYGWEPRIRQGQLSASLLRPVHPIHWDIAFFWGRQITCVVLWIPIAILLSIAFQPAFNFTPLNIVAFFFAVTGAYLIRTLNLWWLGMITVWTTKVGGIFELYISLEMILSGRLVPISLLPAPVRAVTNFLPFQWTFGFPINVLIGKLSPAQIGFGLLAQIFWIGVGAGIVAAFWRVSVKHYSAVGN